MRKNKLFLILAACFFSSAVFSDNNIVNLYINTTSFTKGEEIEDCKLQEIGGALIENSFNADGEFNSASICRVEVPKTKLKMCNLSGVSIYSQNNPRCSVRYSSQNEVWSFSSTKNVSCTFICELQ